MGFGEELGQDFAEVLKYGQQIRFRYFTESYGTGSYDDSVTLTKSGADLFVSGLLRPLSSTQGSKDAVLLAQGRIKQDDQIIYHAGSIQTSGALRIGLGSNTGNEYSIVPNGVVTWSKAGAEIYKKTYVRRLTNGSLFGE